LSFRLASSEEESLKDKYSEGISPPSGRRNDNAFCFFGVIPNLIGNLDYIGIHWIPAFAGMTPRD